ncbi:hypothetical protein CBL_04504 [Carabus blaptoides fortunei]
MFKFALFLVVAFCAVQGFETRTVQIDDRSLEDVINAIKDIIQKVKDIIANIASQIPEIIQNIRDKINEIIENIDLPGIIAKIKEEIEKIIALGEAGKKCVEAEREQIEGLIQNAQAGGEACISTAVNEIAAADKHLAALMAKANEVREDISGRVVQCIEDSKLNPIALFNCLKDQVEPISAELENLQALIQTTIANVTEIAQQMTANLASCLEKVRDDTVAKTDEIISSIKECVAGSA